MLEAERALAVAEAKVGVITRAYAGAVTVCCDPTVRSCRARLRGQARRQSGRAARARAAGGCRGRCCRERHLRRHEPGHPRHGGRARRARGDRADRRRAGRRRGDLRGARGSPPLDRHGRADAAPAGRADDVRPEGGELARRRAARARPPRRASRLPAQLGGAAGTLAALGDRGPDVLHVYAAELGLPEPVVPWHTRRLPFAELGRAHAVAAGFAAKIALDVELLAQTEVGEVREPANGGSSTMPHKRNPVGSTLARACAMRSARRGRPPCCLRSPQEHERAAGAWHAEWGAPVRRARRRPAVQLRGCARRSRGSRSTPSACARTSATTRCRRRDRLGVDASGPEDYLGAADAFVDRALDFYREA